MMPTDPTSRPSADPAGEPEGDPGRRTTLWTAHPFARFLVVGGLNTVLSYAVFRLVLLAVGLRPGTPALAQFCSYLVGLATGYLAHRRVTFQSDGAVGRELPRFIALQLGMLAFTTVALEFLVTRARVPASPAWLVTTAVATVGSFVLQRRMVFAT